MEIRYAAVLLCRAKIHPIEQPCGLHLARNLGAFLHVSLLDWLPVLQTFAFISEYTAGRTLTVPIANGFSRGAN